MDTATGYPVFTSKLAQQQDLIQKHYNIPYHDREKYRIFCWRSARTCCPVMKHRVLAHEVGVRHQGRTITQGLNNDWEESAAFVITPANG